MPVYESPINFGYLSTHHLENQRPTEVLRLPLGCSLQLEMFYSGTIEGKSTVHQEFSAPSSHYPLLPQKLPHCPLFFCLLYKSVFLPIHTSLVWKTHSCPPTNPLIQQASYRASVIWKAEEVASRKEAVSKPRCFELNQGPFSSKGLESWGEWEFDSRRGIRVPY